MFACVSVRLPNLGEGGGDGPESLADWNFVNGTYTTFGNTVMAADCVDQTGWITANGLEIPGSAGAGAEILNEVASYLFDSQFVVAFEYEIIAADFTPATYLLTVTNAGEAFFIECQGYEQILTDGDGGAPRGAWIPEPPGPASVGIHTIAYRRVDALSSVSFEGDASVHSSDSNGWSFGQRNMTLPVEGFPMVNAFFGGYSSFTGQAVNIRRFRLFSSSDVAAADLPNISGP